jgi:hypothetical protein
MGDRANSGRLRFGAARDMKQDQYRRDFLLSFSGKKRA